MSFPNVSESRLRELGQEIYNLAVRLFPICRSITGDGVRETLKVLQEYLPLKVIEVPSGTKVFDWVVPDEWNIKDAYILDPGGKKIVDFKNSNLHILGYSEPVDKKLDLNELKQHLYSIPELPDKIPYRTSYYKRRWGFCVRHDDLVKLKEGTYTVKIDSSFKSGSLTIGECILPGEQQEEILVSSYTCHPSLANDNLSGVVVAAFLGQALCGLKTRYTYRFLFIPETIGAITYLSRNKDAMLSKTHAGIVLSSVGNSDYLRYKQSRQENAEIDRVAHHVMSHFLGKYEINQFAPLGSDERQYCSPGFNLPVGLLTRVALAEIYPKESGYFHYHNSSDNLSIVSDKRLSESFLLLYKIFNALELNRLYTNQVMFCEPQLSKRNLYSTLGSESQFAQEGEKILWTLNYSDGKHDLLEIANKMSLPIETLASSTQELVEAGLIKPL